jgi:hypothetical protein
MRATFFALLTLLPGAAVSADDVRFETHVRPILKAHCFHCHGEEEEKEGNLDVRLARFLAAGGDSGPALVPGKSAESLIYQRVDSGEMPPGDKNLSPQEKETLLRWIDQGALTVRAEPETIAEGSEWTEEERSWWAFQPVVRPAVPSVQRSDLVRTPVDAFLLAKLESEGLSFAPEADRRTLARRLAFDLTGLPLSPERMEAFDANDSPDAYERLVEALLASPAYGERWARHWLDPAGYADSNGYTEKDHERPWSYRYRDYVIRSLNNDKPLDQFIVEQLAGDELLAPPYANLSADDADKLIATGFLRMAPDGTDESGVEQPLARNEVVAETIKIVSTSLLGITVGCAQCHNHRYDPVSQADYYRLRAIFEPALDVKNWRGPSARLVNLWSAEEHEQAGKVQAEVAEIEKQREAERAQIVSDIFEKELAKLPEERQKLAREARETPADKRTAEHQQILKDHPSLNVDGGSAYLYEPQRVNEFNKKYDDLKNVALAKRPADSFVACLTESPGTVPTTHLFYRGDINQPRSEIAPGDLSVLGPLAASIPSDDPALPTTGRRLAWARHLTSGEHPLTARVLANRVWMHHFGRGIVGSPADFGLLGERPSHPELLDYLADELVTSGWRLKNLHRLIVHSTAYRQASQGSETAHGADPENRWLGRMGVRRLEAEAIRDAILEVTGSRSDRMFGPPATVNPDEVGQVIIGKATRDGNGILVAHPEKGEDQFRRTIYVQVRRSMPLGMLEPFDVASTAPNCERRTSSTVPPQSLLMMNSSFILEQAQHFADRVASEAGDDPSAQVQRAWELAYARAPSEEELVRSAAFLEAQRQHFEQLAAAATPENQPALTPPQQALALFCQALLSSNRFLYVE